MFLPRQCGELAPVGVGGRHVLKRGLHFAARGAHVGEMNVGHELKDVLLASRVRTLAVAESLTAGHVQVRVSAVSGASEYFLGGITAYTLAQKVTHLGVDEAMAKRANSVSVEVAEQMARGVCAMFGARVGLATTGYAEPSPENGVTHPFAWWAVAHRGPRGKFAMRHGRVECPGCSRVQTQSIVADAALAELILFLRGIRG